MHAERHEPESIDLNGVYQAISEAAGDVETLVTWQRTEYFLSVEEGLVKLEAKLSGLKSRLHPELHPVGDPQ